MNIFSHHKIIENQNGVEIILYINPNEEFSEELGKANHKTETIENQAQKYVKSRFSNMKVNAIKIMSGAILLTTLSIATMEDHAVEAASNGDNTIVQASYTVKPGDTLSEIAAKNGTTVNAIKSTNNLTSDFLRVGQALTVPTSEAAINPYTGVKEETPKTIHYTVKSGDTLSQIAKDYNTTVSAIQQSSGLSGDFIRVGQALIIPSNQVKDQTHQKQQVEYSEEDLEWLSKIIHSEARGESLDGQIAVAAVILNRVNSNLFPNSVKEVIFEQNNGRYQFTPAGSGSIYT